MLVGAKLGDIWGRTRRSGSASPSTGSDRSRPPLSPNLTVLLFGWSLVEGLGAVLVIPAIAALVAANYEGKDRAFAYGIIGGVAGAAIAVGPVIGGFVTTYFSWRYVFVGEVVIVLGDPRRPQPDAAGPAARPTRRSSTCVGAALSAVGLGLDRLRDPPEQHVGLDHPDRRADDRRPRAHPLRLLARAVPDRRPASCFLWLFAGWEERRERLGRDTLLERSLLTIASLRAGLDDAHVPAARA